jgi:phosphotransferase system enzyme I (PtsI)
MGLQMFGTPVSKGIAIGRAVLVASSRIDVAHYYIEAGAVEAEVARVRAARDAVAAELQTLKSELPPEAPAELAALLDVHLMLLHDETLTGATRAWIDERHYNAEWALSAQLEVLARQFDEMEDEYLRERKADLEQVVERLLDRLAAGEGAPKAGLPLPAAGGDPLVLVASDISPADLLQFKNGVFLGFVTDVGGRTSHTAIVARSLDIPAVVGVREASRLVREDDWVVIDGDSGVIVVDPAPSVRESYERLRESREAARRELQALLHLPSVTRDGHIVTLLANIERPEDAAGALAAGAEGIGLFRSEFLFLNREHGLPGEEEQYAGYRTAVLAMRGLPVTIRTVDIGADKALERMSAAELRHEHVLNPALGLRAIRWSLAEPEMFQIQLRAILRAASDGPVRVLVPMIAQLSEVEHTVQALARARRELEAEGIRHGPVQLGGMVEIPAAALMLPVLLRHFDFVSIGTNDLIQYTLAIDRSDEAVAHLYNPWHPAVLRLVAQTISGAQAAGKDVTVCGEMAGDPQFTELLLAMGLRTFSMHPREIATVKPRVRAADTARGRNWIARVLEADDPERAWTELRAQAISEPLP